MCGLYPQFLLAKKYLFHFIKFDQRLILFLGNFRKDMLALLNVSLWNNISNECGIDAQFVCLFVCFCFFKYTKGVSSEVSRRWLLSKRQLLFRPGQTKQVLLCYTGVVLPFMSSVLRFAGAVCVHVPWKSLETQWVLGSPVLSPLPPLPHTHNFISPCITRMKQQHRVCYRRGLSEVTVRAWNLIFGPLADRGRSSRCSKADVTPEGIIFLTSIQGFVLVCSDQGWTHFLTGI